jgi:plastocyanin
MVKHAFRLLPLFSLILPLGELGAQEKKNKTGSLSGIIKAKLKGLSVKKLGTTVVFLEALSPKVTIRVPKAVPIVDQKNARFVPSILIIVQGQTVDFPNSDKIFHNVFSFSKGNKFDLGIYPKNQSKSVTFKAAGIVRVYCSIHRSMTATIFSVPSNHYAVVNKNGQFKILNIPPGRWRLWAWNRKLPKVKKEIEISAGKILEATLELGVKKK